MSIGRLRIYVITLQKTISICHHRSQSHIFIQMYRILKVSTYMRKTTDTDNCHSNRAEKILLFFIIPIAFIAILGNTTEVFPIILEQINVTATQILVKIC